MDESSSQSEPRPKIALKETGSGQSPDPESVPPSKVVSASGNLKISGRRKIVAGTSTARTITDPPAAPAPSLSRSLKTPAEEAPETAAAATPDDALPTEFPAGSGTQTPKLPQRLAQANAETTAAKPPPPPPAQAPRKLKLSPAAGTGWTESAPATAESDTANQSSSSGLVILLAMAVLILGSVGGAGYLVWGQYRGSLESIPVLSGLFAPEPYSGPPKPGAVAFARAALDGIGGGQAASPAVSSTKLQPSLRSVRPATPRSAASAPRTAAAPAPRSVGTGSLAAPIGVRPNGEIGSEDRMRMRTVSSWLQGIHIGAVKATGAHRVMIDTESYDVGDTVNIDLGLQFAGVKDGKLLFRDENDFIYTKRF